MNDSLFVHLALGLRDADVHFAEQGECDENHED